MSFYLETGEIIHNIISNYILNNQNLCKLLKCYSPVVNYNYNPLLEKDIEDTKSLLMTCIFPLPKSPDAETKQKCFLNIVLSGGEQGFNNKGIRHLQICFDIICHLDAWIISSSCGFLRPIAIMSEIDSMFNNEKTILPILNKPQPLPTRSYSYADKYFGYKLCYDFQVNSNLKCN